MRSDVSERAGTGLRLFKPPVAREVGPDQPVLKVRPAIVIDFPDSTLFNDLLRKRHRRGATVVVTEHVNYALSAHCFEHRLSFGKRVCERLLTEDDFVCNGGRNCDWHMRVTWRADVNDVNV